MFHFSFICQQPDRLSLAPLLTSPFCKSNQSEPKRCDLVAMKSQCELLELSCDVIDILITLLKLEQGTTTFNCHYVFLVDMASSLFIHELPPLRLFLISLKILFFFLVISDYTNFRFPRIRFSFIIFLKRLQTTFRLMFNF